MPTTKKIKDRLQEAKKIKLKNNRALKCHMFFRKKNDSLERDFTRRNKK